MCFTPSDCDSLSGLPTVVGTLLVLGERGTIAGIGIEHGRPAAHAPPPQPAQGPAQAEGAPQEALVRFGGDAAWLCEDCDVKGAVRIGGRAEVALVNCRIQSAHDRGGAQAGTTGLLVQGSARVLLRACVVSGHRRSGCTVQHRARLWAHASKFERNQLAGVKILASAGQHPGTSYLHALTGSGSVLQDCAITDNRGMGVILRGGAQVALRQCTVRSNGTLGVAALERSKLELDRCELSANEGFGLVCQHNAGAILRRTRVEANAGVGVVVAESASLHLSDTSVYSNALAGVRAENRTSLLIQAGTHLWANGVGASRRRTATPAGGGGGGGSELNLVLHGPLPDSPAEQDHWSARAVVAQLDPCVFEPRPADELPIGTRRSHGPTLVDPLEGQWGGQCSHRPNGLTERDDVDLSSWPPEVSSLIPEAILERAFNTMVAESDAAHIE